MPEPTPIYYTSQDIDDDRKAVSTWSVYREFYRQPDDAEPIDGMTVHVSTHASETAAWAAVETYQKGA